MRTIATLMAVTLALAACGPFPDDLEGTSERIERTGVIRVAMTRLHAEDRDRAARFLSNLAAAKVARLDVADGPAERALAALEAGKLDVVIGEFAHDSPWVADVSLIEPISTRTVGDRKIGLAPVAANGENRWIATLEKTVRDLEAVR
ncbi:hypothetical protein ACWPMX_05025 [Tsuneonella sp. HG094]|jgi:ABC-type amino acid transport substrate-binding protein